MLYDDGFMSSDNSNHTVATTESTVRDTAVNEAVEEAHDEHVGALNADAASKTSGSHAHELPQHSHRNHHQTQQAVSSP